MAGRRRSVADGRHPSAAWGQLSVRQYLSAAIDRNRADQVRGSRPCRLHASLTCATTSASTRPLRSSSNRPTPIRLAHLGDSLLLCLRPLRAAWRKAREPTRQTSGPGLVPRNQSQRGQVHHAGITPCIGRASRPRRPEHRGSCGNRSADAERAPRAWLQAAADLGFGVQVRGATVLASHSGIDSGPWRSREDKLSVDVRAKPAEAGWA